MAEQDTSDPPWYTAEHRAWLAKHERRQRRQLLMFLAFWLISAMVVLLSMLAVALTQHVSW